MPTRYLIDANHLTYLLQKHLSVIAELERRLTAGDYVDLLPLVLYEVQRWLRLRQVRGEDVSGDYATLAQLIQLLRWTEADVATCRRAADVWVAMRMRGQRRPREVDCLLIGAAAEMNGVLVTADRRAANEARRHGVVVENWYAP